jgi:hypothetical protein
MKRLLSASLVIILVFGLAAFATYGFFFRTRFDEPSLFSLLNLYASLILVLVTGAYVISTKRYVDLFQLDTETRQAAQEEWELRRFYASRIFSIADGIAELFYASKRELEMYLEQAEFLEGGVSEIHRAAIANTRGMGTITPAVAGRVDSLWDVNNLKYNDRAKDYNWRAQVLIHQARPLVDEALCDRMVAVFQLLSRNFQSSQEGREVLRLYEQSFPEITQIIRELQIVAAQRATKEAAAAIRIKISPPSGV